MHIGRPNRLHMHVRHAFPLPRCWPQHPIPDTVENSICTCTVQPSQRRCPAHLCRVAQNDYGIWAMRHPQAYPAVHTYRQGCGGNVLCAVWYPS